MKHLSRNWALLMIGALAVIPAADANERLDDLIETTKIAVDESRVSVSGLSSGGYMAHQFHLAHSRRIMGVGILAGGPYACAEGYSLPCDSLPTWYGFYQPGNVCRALHVCSAIARQEAPFYFKPFRYFGPPGHDHSLSVIERAARAGTIDPLRYLEGDRVWLYTSEADTTVPAGVMAAVQALYTALFKHPDVADPSPAVTMVRREDAAHAMPIDLSGEPDHCGRTGPPYINDCSLDAAGELLTFIYGIASDDAPGHDAWHQGSLLSFDQTAFFDTGDASTSLHTRGYLYVPAICRGGQSCPLHVAFHGCRQYEDYIRDYCADTGDCAVDYFFEDAGYNAWAEQLGIIILYPQTSAWGGPQDLGRNPRGCWDWWGYSGPEYAGQAGKQIRAVRRMIDCLIDPTGDSSQPQRC